MFTEEHGLDLQTKPFRNIPPCTANEFFYYIQTPIVTFLATFYPPSTRTLSRSNELDNGGFVNVGFVFINRVTETSITYRLLQLIIRVVFSNLDLSSNIKRNPISSSNF